METQTVPQSDTRPTFETARLILRPFRLEDAKTVQRLAGDKVISDLTGTIPYPYPDGLAESWIQKHPEHFATGVGLTMAVTLKETGELIGCVGIMIAKTHQKGEIGYWLTPQHWSKGYITEASRVCVDFAFKNMGLNKITSRHLTHNPASGKVMQKIGMKHEGTLRQETFKNGAFYDLDVYGLLKSEFLTT
ncbi:GNAT family N-acetyltransferase [Bdellovibrio sp. HCB337]|uniref:GNAT family N-acetyltransferase n=1 Tax=Bdellovibrio sp. HCB337 TaxID=3394358 RepID=UPI0039A46821